MASEFGPYQLIALLGRGGMGEVYRAFDRSTNRQVALKLLPPHLASDSEFRQRFLREAEIAASLTEPHVVPIHRYGEIDGRLYVDMRLIQGRDLQAVLAHGPLAPDRALHVVDQVGAALDAAHRAGLVHRDVKPSNILLTDRDFAYLIDFGIARSVDEPGLTRPGEALGSVAYMAPERFTTTAVDRRVDVYALTCVLYECLTGQRAVGGSSAAELLAGHVMKPPPRPSAFGFPPALDEVIATGMAKDPAGRYGSPDILVRAARIALGYAPPANLVTQQWAAPMSAPPARRGVTRGGVLLAVGALAVVATLVATIVVIVGRDDPGADQTAGPGSTGGSQTVDVDDLLLGVPELAAITGLADLTVIRSGDKLIEESDRLPTAPERCRPVATFENKQYNAGKGIDQLRYIGVAAPGNDFLARVDEAAFQFPDAQDATRYFDDLAEVWQSCDDTDYTMTDADTKATTVDRLEGFSREGDVVTLTRTPDDAPKGYSCQQALTFRSAFVLVTRVCGFAVGDQGAEIATTILDRIPADASPAPAQPPTPALEPMLLDASAASGVMGVDMTYLGVNNGLGTPLVPAESVTPAGCAPVASSGSSTSYTNVTWREAISAELTTVTPQSVYAPILMGESVVVASSDAAAAKYLSDAEGDWRSCLNTVYKLSPTSQNELVVRSVVPTPGRLIADIRQQSGAWGCSHGLAVTGAYIVEAMACGQPPVNAAAVLDAILTRIP